MSIGSRVRMLSKVRRQRGSLLGLAAALLWIFILLGSFTFYILEMLGGDREHNTATQAGNLNHAKNALVLPSVTLDANTAPDSYMLGLIGSDHKVSLENYNTLFGFGAMVALNAVNDGNSTGITNATALLNRIQGTGSTSIAYQLQDQLTELNTTNPNWFTDVARRNSTRMLSTETLYQREYEVGYMEPEGCTNIKLISPQNQMPYNNTLTQQVEWPADWQQTYDSEQYLKGYKAITTGALTACGVPVQPYQQPHGVSPRQFWQHRTQPLSGTLTVPSNAFMHSSSVMEKQTQSDMLQRAAGIVGCLTTWYKWEIPQGYLVIDNTTPTATLASLPDPIHIPINWNVTAWILGQGVAVDVTSGYFSDNITLMQDWATVGRDPNSLSITGIYDNEGYAVTSNAQVAAAISEGGEIVICTDTNSDSSAPDGGNATCVAHMTVTPPATACPFDQAYFGGTPQYWNEVANTLPVPASSLCAALVGHCYGNTPYSIGQWVSIDQANPLITGSQVWYDNHNVLKGERAAYTMTGEGFNQVFEPDYADYCNASVPYGVQRDGTAEELANQVTEVYPYTETVGGTSDTSTSTIEFAAIGASDINTGGVSNGGVAAAGVSGNASMSGGVTTIVTTPPAVLVRDRVRNFLNQRMCQIKADSTEEERNAVLNTLLALGSKYYIYKDSATNNLVINTTQPPAYAGDGVQPDGTPITWTTSAVSLNNTLANCFQQNAIHDNEFMSQQGELYTQQDCTVWPSCGYNNFLGQVNFRTLAWGDSEYFDRN